MMKPSPPKLFVRSTAASTLRHRKTAAICSVVLPLALAVLVSKRLDSTHTQSDLSYQLDFAKIFANHEDVKWVPERSPTR
jgi:hypothetical protein